MQIRRKLWRLFMPLCIILVICMPVPTATASLYVTADAAVVVDAETGTVLFSKNMHQRRAPASTTKIMTTILGIELGQINDVITTSPRAAAEGGSSIWLTTGEKLSLEELLYGIMLNSGNDAAVAVAEYIAGSVEDFALLMNQKAREVGALNTTFCNPNGLPNDNHLTTAYDLAMMMRYAMQNELFRKITATVEKKISWPGNQWDRVLHNHNKLLWQYTDADGGKTGYTRAAGRCLVSTAKRNGRRVIAVVLHADQLWQDSIKLLDYGLDQFTNVTLLHKGEVIDQVDIPDSREKLLELAVSRDFVVTIPNNQKSQAKTQIRLYEELPLPIVQNQKVGILDITVNDQPVGQIELLAKNQVTEKSLVYRFWRWISSVLKTLT